MLDDLFAALLEKHTLNEIYEMDLLEFLRLMNRDKVKKKPKREVDSFFDLF